MKTDQGKNELIINQDIGRTRGALTNIQRRGMNSILKRGLEQIKKNKNTKIFKIPIEQLLKDMQLDYKRGQKNKIKEIKKPLENLMTILFIFGKKEEPETATFMQYTKVTEKEISFKFTDYIHERLDFLESVMIVRNFTTLQSFKSQYAGQLYKHIHSWRDKGFLKLTIKDLKDFLGVPDTNSYKRMDNLKKKVINVAVNEINKISEVELRYEQEKKGRVITHFIFIWNIKKEEPKIKKKNNVEIIIEEEKKKEERGEEKYKNKIREIYNLEIKIMDKNYTFIREEFKNNEFSIKIKFDGKIANMKTNATSYEGLYVRFLSLYRKNYEIGG